MNKTNLIESESPGTTCLAAALAYAKRGWHVFPVHTTEDGICGCSRPECNSPGKHPHITKWQIEATDDIKKIAKWWRKWPDANVAVATGSKSRLIVIDVDGESGKTSLQALKNASDVPDTLTAITARGIHLFFANNDGIPIMNSAGTKLGPGIDVRGECGYVVAAPSKHVSGVLYQWEDETKLVATAPDWLLELLTEEDLSSEEEAVHTIEADASIKEGQRNKSLFELGCSLRANGLSQDTIENRLLVVNQEKCVPPLAAVEITAIAKSIANYPAGKGKAGSTPTNNKSPLFWYKFFVNDWFGDPNIRLMDARQRGLLISLQTTAFQQAGLLRNDPAKLWKWAGASSRREFEANSKTVLEQFEETNIQGVEMLIHRKLKDSWEDAYCLWKQKRAAGNASVEARSGKL